LNSILTAPLIGFPSGIELVIIFAVVLLLFGGAKLPQLAKSMGQAMRNFKDETSKLKREVEVAANEEETKANTKKASSTQSQSTANADEPVVEQKN